MSKPYFLSDLIKQLTNALPTHIGSIKQDFEKNCRAILNQAFDKMDLVKREEFDIQTKVLARTRQKCEALEAELKSLEAQLKQLKSKSGKKHD